MMRRRLALTLSAVALAVAGLPGSVVAADSPSDLLLDRVEFIGGDLVRQSERGRETFVNRNDRSPVRGATPQPTSGFLHNDMVVVEDPLNTDLFTTREYSSTAGADPSGYVDFYQFTSLYTLGTDRIAVFTCDFAGDVDLSVSEATAIGNSEVSPHFSALSEGRYTLEFVEGSSIAGAVDDEDCLEEAAGWANNGSNPDVNGVMVIADINGGYAGPGSTCAVSACGKQFPANGRWGFATDRSLIDTVWSHEHGHMIGWPHSSSGSTSGNAYDNPIDLMSGNRTAGNSTNPDPYESIAFNRLAAGWVDPGQIITYTGGSVEIDIAVAGTPGTQLVVVPVDGNTFFTIDARISDANDPFPNSWSGVEVMYIDNLDICPGSYPEPPCYPLYRTQETAGGVPWTGGVPYHVLTDGESATLTGYEIEVVQVSADSVRLSIIDQGVSSDYVHRLAGSDRYETAVAVSSEMFPEPSKVDTVFVATGLNFPDALGAAAAAGYMGAPVLLVGDSLPATTANELARLDPATIYVVGGTAAISDSIASELGSYGTVERLAGTNRYATAGAVSAGIFTSPGDVDTVFVATGDNFPDALGAAAAAGHVGSPVLLVGDTVPSATANELLRLNPSTIYVVGGTAVIPSTVAGDLGSYGTVTRIAGPNRYATAAAVSSTVFADAGMVDSVFVATGSNFPDALGAAAAAGHLGAPVLLVDDSVPGATATEIERLKPLSTVYIAGGTAVVSNAVAAAL